LEHLLAKGKIGLPYINPKTKGIRKPKFFESTKYCKYHRAWGHDNENDWTFKNWLRWMFKLE